MKTFFGLLFILSSLASFTSAQDLAGTTTQPVKLVDDQYPHAGLSAQEAADAMKLPEGFSVSVFAAEPDVKQPIAMALDHRGRVWIAEAYEYPRRAEGNQGRDRILVFEDVNGDGVFDQRKVFAEGLNLVSGLEVGFGGVWVGAAPYLLFIPDRDGDDVPDGEPQILLDGWGYQDTHETLNAFLWGPDGWLYGCHGVFTHSRVGKPGTPDPSDQRTPINAGIWRYHPTKHQFEVFAHGTSNPWGIDFNDHGQAFCTACVIPHLYHVIQGARYQRQAGNHFNNFTYQDIPTIADHLHFLGAWAHQGNNKSDTVGGGHAHAGAMIYLGGSWPEKYRDQIFMNNIHGQRLNMDTLTPHGSGYIGSHGPDFLLTGDRASQILNLRYGPDGQAYMIDWYDMQACHHGDSAIHDRSNGRIYKIRYGESQDGDESLTDRSDVQLAELTLHPNDWYVRHARRILQERAALQPIDQEARNRLFDIATHHTDDTRRLRAVWALHVTGGLTDEAIAKLLHDVSPYVRGWAIQLLMEENANQLGSHWLTQLATMAKEDPSPVVRLYLASAAQQLSLAERWDILIALTAHTEDAGDHNLPLMYWYVAEPLAEVDVDRAMALGLSAGESIPLLRELMLRRIGGPGDRDSLTALVRGLQGAKTTDIQLAFLKALRSALTGQRQAEPPENWADAYEVIAESAGEDVRSLATSLGVTFGDARALEQFRNIIQSPSTPVNQREDALQTLLAAKDPGLASTLQQLVGDSDLRMIALRGLAMYDDAKTPSVLISIYPDLTPDERRSALATLCSRQSYATQLFAAIKEEKLPGSDLTADLVRQLQFLKSEAIDRELASVWGSVRETDDDKAQLIMEYQRMLASTGKADPQLGRAVFAKTCQQCHTLYGVGHKIGPDLTGSNRSDLNYLLSNIVDPSALMAKEYQQTMIITMDGQLVSGIVRGEDDQSLTIQTTDALVVLPKDEIDERLSSDRSMMPDDQLKQFNELEIRSLIAYLRGKQQIPMRATQDNASTLFNGEDLSGWLGDESLWSVEDGEIVGRTNGIGRNEWLISDLLADDFRLTLDVKLLGNQGNSGIQFRSRIDKDSVAGYQADIGSGWWGKLYEEHGRALLWDKSGEEHVKDGQWNTYTIEAKGSEIRTWINGQLCVDLDDPEGSRSGIFALQLHSGGPTEVRFRNIRLTVLSQQEAEDE